jgi:hypothetical protein
LEGEGLKEQFNRFHLKAIQALKFGALFQPLGFCLQSSLKFSNLYFLCLQQVLDEVQSFETTLIRRFYFP